MKKVNVNSFIDHQKFNRFHLILVISCMFIIICDGYDMFMLGAILPTLMNDWGINPVVAGKLGSYALIGMMLGALIFGPLADKMGRKNVILTCVAIFTVFTFTSGFANGPDSFGFQRFLAGLGLGGVMPNLIALVTEYAPKKHRSILVSIMFSGHAAGGILASIGALNLIPHFGWRPVVWIASIPILFIPVLIKVLPESYAYYLMKNKKEKLALQLNKIDLSSHFTAQDEFFAVVATNSKGTVTKLFNEKRALSTVMFWIAAFMCLLVMYGLSTWLPKFMQVSGFPMGSSLLFLITLNVGAIVGAIYGGRLADKFNARLVLISFFMIGFAALTLLSLKPNMFILYILLFIAGGATTGTQIIMNAYVSQYYPNEIRSTGVGWELGIGRIGGILGPTLGGILLSSHLPLQINFFAFAIPCIISAIAMLVVREKHGFEIARPTHQIEVS